MRILNSNKGQTLFTVMVFLGIVFIFTIGLITYLASSRLVSQRVLVSAQALNLAEAGLDKAIWCLNHPDIYGLDYAGETQLLGEGSFITTVVSIGDDYIIDSIGTIGNTQKKLISTVTQETTSTGAAFHYGVQIGAGGIEMSNNSYIVGNIYSNGSIVAGNGAYVTGDAYVAGGTELTADQQQLFKTSDFSFGDRTDPDDVADIAISFSPGISAPINFVSFLIKKTSSPSDADVYIAEDDNGQPKTAYLASGTLDATKVAGLYSWVDVSFSSNPWLTMGETYWIIIDVNPKKNTYYTIGMQGSLFGDGVYSDDWSLGSWTAANGNFTYKTWMGGIVNYIDGLIVGDDSHVCDAVYHGNAYAHQILNSQIICDAFYDEDPDDIAGTTVGGNKHPNSEDPPPEIMPFTYPQMQLWKDAAEAGGIIDDDYTLDNNNTDSLGPIKITGDMLIDNGSQLTVSGTIWVEGDITFSNGSDISLDPGYRENSGIIVSDGQIQVLNNCVFSGSGLEGSYIMILTTNESLLESSPAVDINNNAEAVIFYASNGMIKVANNASLREVSGYKLFLGSGASITYEAGLANINFANGPGGIWTAKHKTWQEIE